MSQGPASPLICVGSFEDGLPKYLAHMGIIQPQSNQAVSSYFDTDLIFDDIHEGATPM